MYNILKKLKETDTIAEFYANHDDYDKFIVGYVNSISEEDIVIFCLDPHGKFDGYIALHIDNIYKIEIETIYLNKIRKLFQPIPPMAHFNKKNLFTNILEIANQRNNIAIVSIIDLEIVIRGYVEDISDEIITIQQIDEYGNMDGKCMFYTADIIRIIIQDSECIELEKLSYGN